MLFLVLNRVSVVFIDDRSVLAHELWFSLAGILEIELMVMVVDNSFEVEESVVDFIVAGVDRLDEGFDLDVGVVNLMPYLI